MRRLLMFCFMIVSFSVSAAMQSEFDYTVAADQNTFTVRLTSNPTTGFQWILMAYDHKLINLNASQFMASKSRLMGASGTMIYNFSVLQGVKRPDRSSMIFVYRRPWESNTGTKQVVTIHFNH